MKIDFIEDEQKHQPIIDFIEEKNIPTNKIDFPFLIAITGIFTLFGFDMILNGESSNILSRTESIILVILLVLYLSILIFNANRSRKRKLKQNKYFEENNFELPKEETQEKQLKVWQIILYLILCSFKYLHTSIRCVLFFTIYKNFAFPPILNVQKFFKSTSFFTLIFSKLIIKNIRNFCTHYCIFHVIIYAIVI